MQSATTIFLVIIISIFVVFLLVYFVKAVRKYWKDHTCSFCHKFYPSEPWFLVCETCGNRFCKDKIGRHEDIIDTIVGILGETVRVLDRRDRGYRPEGWITVCGYEHIITLHKVNSVSLYYCAHHHPGKLGADTLMDKYQIAKSKRRHPRNTRQVSGWE